MFIKCKQVFSKVSKCLGDGPTPPVLGYQARPTRLYKDVAQIITRKANQIKGLIKRSFDFEPILRKLVKVPSKYDFKRVPLFWGHTAQQWGIFLLERSQILNYHSHKTITRPIQPKDIGL